MTNRTIRDKVQGYRTSDGAGVSLVRVLGKDTVEGYDPLLMLDSFDSSNPEDYVKGFPEHPHRGIETITFLERGWMDHRDSLGNSGSIRAGDVQWMTAGSGIMHEEMPQPSDRMLGVQVWLNLPQGDKMCPPAYHALEKKDIPVHEIEGGSVSVISGDFAGTKGFQAPYHNLSFFSIKLEAGQRLDLPTKSDTQVIVFLLEGDAEVAGEDVEEKTAVVTHPGDRLSLAALEEQAHLLYFEGKVLAEPVVWGGPIVMNTREELHQAWLDLRNNTFVKEGAQSLD